MKKICVAISCYNQKRYIEECIKHLLLQRCEEYLVEIMLCDDASTDGTRELVIGMMNRLPIGWKFKDCSNSTNLGMPLNTKRILKLLIESDAEYGCILEGDDYWISPFYLKKHIEPLLKDEEATMTNNYITIYYQEHNKYVIRDYPQKVHDSRIVLPEMQAEDNYMGNFSSSVYKIDALRCIPIDFLEQPYVDDWFVNLLLAIQGKAISIKEPLSVYRVHSESVWNGKKRKVDNTQENTISQRIRFIHKHYPRKYLKELANFSEHWAKIPMCGKLYYDTGAGYNEKQVLTLYTMFENRTEFWIEEDISGIAANIQALRYDPEEGYECEMAECKCLIDGKEIEALPINGQRYKEKIIFATKDPMFELKINSAVNNAKIIRIEGKIEF